MNQLEFKYRKAILSDIPELRELVKSTIRAINKADYEADEIEDWASCSDDLAHLEDLITHLYFIVSLDDEGLITGCSSIRKDGYLHSMFIHKDYQQRGIASFLLSKMEEYAAEQHMTVITSEVSITAKPFFEKKGYKVEKEQKRRAKNLYLTNYWMKKVL